MSASAEQSISIEDLSQPGHPQVLVTVRFRRALSLQPLSFTCSLSEARALANALFSAARELETGAALDAGSPCCGSRNTTYTDEGVCQACGTLVTGGAR